MKKPSPRIPVAVTLGDPRGVGPEVLMRALDQRRVISKVAPIVVGSPAVARRAHRLVRAKTSLVALPPGDMPGRDKPGVAYLLCPAGTRPTQTGSGDARESGRMSFGSLKEAVRLCLEGRALALVTAPISKASLGAAGIPFKGHTEALRDLCRVKETVMMFVWGAHRISLVTTHVPLREVKRSLTRRGIETTILFTARALKLLFKVTEPRLAVLSLNPHSGESGLLGSEEKEVIGPAMGRFSEQGVLVRGPFAADAFFSRSEWKAFDAVVAMYHDQGLIAAKILGGERAVNVTLGLPFVRTSPGHGTAEDIAWKGVADPDAMVSAILLAARLARNASCPLEWSIPSPQR
ncbi:MAG: 4-hydroxythreonine-4-phosphate dehydrogenase PdxA [Candidatus Eiseniibacteriota bacterium]|nr:MAG: 4-hydroxythreonine-4-phosphate dehydrogenase PdxA [Candidatus Eisenbacteria bacterium]